MKIIQVIIRSGLLFLLLCFFNPVFAEDTQVQSDQSRSLGGVGYYLASHTNDTIPSMMEAGRKYQANITFMNRGFVSWEWGTIEKFGMLYQGMQSSVDVSPTFSPVPDKEKIPSGQMITFPVELTPPQKTGNYTLGFSMATLKREGYVPFADGFTKEIQVIPQDGISSAEFGSISIDSVPSGASVSLNGKPSGVTPLTIPDLNPAKYSLDISLDLQTRTVSVPVDASSVSHVSVDFTSDQKPVVRSEHLERFTLLGWILGNIPLIVITVAVIFAGLQFMMLDTKRFPEEHILRRYAKPFTLVNVKFDGEHQADRKRSDDTRGKAVSDNLSGEGGIQGERRGSGSSSSGRAGTKNLSVTDRKRRDDQIGKKKKQADSEEEFENPDDVDQEQQRIDNPWGFPDQLKDRYEPLGIAGDDSYARVFKVKAVESGLIRALKISHIKGAGSEILRKEASVWGSLRHPNIVRLFKAEYSEDLTFLENEFLDGIRYKGNNLTSLSALPKPLKEKYAVAVIKDIAQGLKYAHNYGIRHYHIQTGDVLLTPDFKAKISGFARGKNEIGFSIPDSDIKDIHNMYITHEQRDPETYGNPGKRTDIYQLGVIFYELLTGYLPYSREAYEKVSTGGYEEHQTELILPSRFRSDKARYDPIIEKMLSLEKKNRYSSVEDLLLDLEDLS